MPANARQCLRALHAAPKHSNSRGLSRRDIIRSVFLAVIVLGCCQSFVFVCTVVLVRRWYERERERLATEVREVLEGFVKSPDAETPSPLAILLDQAALLFSARLAQQLKAMLSGVESGESKGQQLAMLEEASASNPLISLLAGILPARIRNRLMKNPQMIGALSRLGGGGNHTPTAPSGGAPTNYSL